MKALGAVAFDDAARLAREAAGGGDEAVADARAIVLGWGRAGRGAASAAAPAGGSEEGGDADGDASPVLPTRRRRRRSRNRTALLPALRAECALAGTSPAVSDAADDEATAAARAAVAALAAIAPPELSPGAPRPPSKAELDALCSWWAATIAASEAAAAPPPRATRTTAVGCEHVDGWNPTPQLAAAVDSLDNGYSATARRFLARHGVTTVGAASAWDLATIPTNGSDHGRDRKAMRDLQASLRDGGAARAAAKQQKAEDDERAEAPHRTPLMRATRLLGVASALCRGAAFIAAVRADAEVVAPADDVVVVVPAGAVPGDVPSDASDVAAKAAVAAAVAALVDATAVAAGDAPADPPFDAVAAARRLPPLRASVAAPTPWWDSESDARLLALVATHGLPHNDARARELVGSAAGRAAWPRARCTSPPAAASVSGGGGGPKGAVCAIPAGADWRAYVEAIRPLKTNCGVPIRKLVEAALAALDDDGAADADGQECTAIRRELTEAKRAWVGNAAGTCKRGALAALDARGGWDGPPLDWQRHAGALADATLAPSDEVVAPAADEPVVADPATIARRRADRRPETARADGARTRGPRRTGQPAAHAQGARRALSRARHGPRRGEGEQGQGQEEAQGRGGRRAIGQ